ncbi:tropomyosin-like [Oscarella lobularis]|uniref:tropomyosin-like n=1 Tax=Oscarella lobularis TaxID=121494 RepID=UPI0033141AEE
MIELKKKTDAAVAAKTEKRKRFEERALQAGQEVEEKTVDLQHAQNGLKRVEEELSAANEEVEELVRRLEATRIETRQQEGVIEELTRRNEDLEMITTSVKEDFDKMQKEMISLKRASRTEGMQQRKLQERFDAEIIASAKAKSQFVEQNLSTN